MRKLMLSLGLTSTLVLGACPDELPRASLIDKLRVLAVRADQPEVVPGTTVALDALVVGHGDTPVTYRWHACLAPERGRGFFGGGAGTGSSGGNSYAFDAPLTCAEVYALDPTQALDLGSDAIAALTIPEDFLKAENVALAYGLGDFEALPDELIFGITAIAGVNMTVSLEVQAGDEVVQTFKRVNVSLAPDTNVNPEPPRFDLRTEDAEETPVPASDTVSVGSCLPDDATLSKGTFLLRPLDVPDPPTSYSVIAGTTDPDEPFRLIETEEVLFYSFFSTEGIFDREIIKSTGTPEASWRFEEVPSGPIPLWVVVRDGRGGVSWCRSDLP